eukprot:scaffold376581_cov18-Prasinocladus_malaysianus.AAC.1
MRRLKGFHEDISAVYLSKWSVSFLCLNEPMGLHPLTPSDQRQYATGAAVIDHNHGNRNINTLTSSL